MPPDDLPGCAMLLGLCDVIRAIRCELRYVVLPRFVWPGLCIAYTMWCYQSHALHAIKSLIYLYYSLLVSPYKRDTGSLNLFRFSFYNSLTVLFNGQSVIQSAHYINTVFSLFHANRIRLIGLSVVLQDNIRYYCDSRNWSRSFECSRQIIHMVQILSFWN